MDTWSGIVDGVEIEAEYSTPKKNGGALTRKSLLWLAMPELWFELKEINR